MKILTFILLASVWMGCRNTSSNAGCINCEVEKGGLPPSRFYIDSSFHDTLADSIVYYFGRELTAPSDSIHYWYLKLHVLVEQDSLRRAADNKYPRLRIRHFDKKDTIGSLVYDSRDISRSYEDSISNNERLSKDKKKSIKKRVNNSQTINIGGDNNGEINQRN